MSDSVASFPDVADVQQKLPDGISETISQVRDINTVHVPTVSVVPIVPVTTFGSSPVQHVEASYNLVVSSANGLVTVVGNSRPFRNNFYAIGGRWDKGESRWKFDAKHEVEVKTLVEAIGKGTVLPEKFVPFKYKKQNNSEKSLLQGSSLQSNLTSASGGISSMLPTLPNSSPDYQTITYPTVYLPRVGMIASITVGKQAEEFSVIKVGTTGTNVDHALIALNGGKASELVVIKGHWVVNGMLEQHRVFFKKSNKKE